MFYNNSFRAFREESETIDRIIEVSIMGVLNDGRFQRGLIDIPLVFSDAYMLADTEVQKIFEFSSDLTTSVCIGSINDYKEEKLFISANSLFASHIGIFGNTGSGKSCMCASLIQSLLIGAILAAVSPAVVVPRMVDLIQTHRGTKKQVPQMILAGASLDDVFVLVLFSAFLTIALGGSVSAWTFMQVPVSIISGILGGAGLGYLLNLYIFN